MNVSRNTPNAIFLSDLEPGDVFELDGLVYILANDGEVHDSGVLPCVKLVNGHLYYIRGDLRVFPYYNAELKY